MSRGGIGQRLHGLRRRSWFYFEHLERVLLQDQLREARPYVSGVLLDVGCGGKPYRALFEDSVAAYVGLDYPPTHLAVEDVHHVAMADVYGDGARLPIRSGAVDTVLCTQTLEHVPEPWLVVDEIARVLRPDGCLILTAPMAWGLHGEPHDYYRFTKYGLRSLAERSGLDVTYVRPRGGFWALMGQLFSTHVYRKWCSPLSHRGADLAYALVGLFVLPLCAASQLTGALLDRVCRRTDSTMGYIMVARKDTGRGRVRMAGGTGD